MAEENGAIQLLILKHLKDDLTEAENGELQDWLSLSEENREIFRQLTDPEQLQEDMHEFHEAKVNIWEKIDNQLQDVKLISIAAPPPRRRKWVYAAAAGVLLLISGALYLRVGKLRVAETARQVKLKEDVPPGGNRAILTLSNGRQIILDNTQNGSLAEQSGSTITRKDSNSLIYTPSHKRAAGIVYNTLTTPRSGQFRVMLPDSTIVWLNAASSLKYPVSFAGQASRLVELSGEAYFEVSKNIRQPFKIHVNDLSIDVLGTSFNVMAYADEPVLRTTLLEGAVKVSRGTTAIILRPGQQVGATGADLQLNQHVDLEEAIAWKNGLFEFNGADIAAVMRQLARWYDVQVVYEGKRSAYSISGMVNRSNNISTVLDILELSGFHFTLEGKTVTVLP